MELSPCTLHVICPYGFWSSVNFPNGNIFDTLTGTPLSLTSIISSILLVCTWYVSVLTIVEDFIGVTLNISPKATGIKTSVFELIAGNNFSDIGLFNYCILSDIIIFKELADLLEISTIVPLNISLKSSLDHVVSPIYICIVLLAHI